MPHVLFFIALHIFKLCLDCSNGLHYLQENIALNLKYKKKSSEKFKNFISFSFYTMGNYQKYFSLYTVGNVSLTCCMPIIWAAAAGFGINKLCNCAKVCKACAWSPMAGKSPGSPAVSPAVETGGGGGLGLLAIAAKVANAASICGFCRPNICCIGLQPGLPAAPAAKPANRFWMAEFEVGGGFEPPFCWDLTSGVDLVECPVWDAGDFRPSAESADSADSANWIACSAASRAAAWMDSRLGLTDLVGVASRSSGERLTDR